MPVAIHPAVVGIAALRAEQRQRHTAKHERYVEPVPLGYMSSLFSDFNGSRLRARNLRCFFDNLKRRRAMGRMPIRKFQS